MTTETRPSSVAPAPSPFSGGGLRHAAGVYDYIFTGAGCAGLSLLIHLHRAGLLAGKKVLVIDQDQKRSNDRTWCFWEQGAGMFESIVFKSWNQLNFYSKRFSGPLQIAPYSYKLIRGIDFYNACFAELGDLSEIDWLQSGVSGISEVDGNARVAAGGKQFAGRFVFNSIMQPQPALASHQYWLLQHFKGWVIDTDEDCFDPGKATLMDFRVGQERGCTFVYVLPFSPRRALVEYTLFSKELLTGEEYDQALQQYISGFLGISSYRIQKEEFGVIPMTNYAFPRRNGPVLNIGTAGGSTKASSGYTFRFIQKHAAGIADSIRQHGHPFAARSEAVRFSFYDSVLLHILHHNRMDGARIFADLFARNKGGAVLRFLDNESSVGAELRLITTVPWFTFTRAAVEYFFARAFR